MRAMWFVLLAMIVFATGCTKSKQVKEEKQTPAEKMQEAKLARGQYLAEAVMGCMDCHSERNFQNPGGPVVPGTEYQGGIVFDENFLMDGRPFPGRVQAPNITQAEETGIGTWSADDIHAAVRQGERPDGEPIFPIMPYSGFRHITEEDAEALVAYLQSLPAIENETLERNLKIPKEAYASAAGLPPEPMTITDTKSKGKYLVTLAGCGDCHTPQLGGKPDMDRMLAGGMRLTTPAFDIMVPNLTPDPETGLGRATEQDFFLAIREGRPIPNGENKSLEGTAGTLHPIMPWVFHKDMTDDDIHAMWVYLQSLPPVKLKTEEIAGSPSQ